MRASLSFLIDQYLQGSKYWSYKSRHFCISKVQTKTQHGNAIKSPGHLAHRQPWQKPQDLLPQEQTLLARQEPWQAGSSPQDKGTHYEPPPSPPTNLSTYIKFRVRSVFCSTISYLLKCRATAERVFGSQEGTNRHQPWAGYWSFPQVYIGPTRHSRINPRTAALSIYSAISWSSLIYD